MPYLTINRAISANKQRYYFQKMGSVANYDYIIRHKISVFKDEIKKKFDIIDNAFPFTLTMLSRSRLIISGVRGIVKLNDNELCFRLKGGRVTVTGSSLSIKEMGGGDVYVIGNVGGISFEE